MAQAPENIDFRTPLDDDEQGGYLLPSEMVGVDEHGNPCIVAPPPRPKPSRWRRFAWWWRGVVNAVRGLEE